MQLLNDLADWFGVENSKEAVMYLVLTVVFTALLFMGSTALVLLASLI